MTGIKETAEFVNLVVAIAGVINIVLNKNVNELNLTVTTGGHFSENSNEQTGGVDGEMTNISANYGLPIGDNTPEEISISIIAELLQVRDSLKRST